MANPDVLVFGPVSKGELSSRGDSYPAAGYAWCCGTCKRSKFGFVTEDDADFDALAHACLDSDRA